MFGQRHTVNPRRNATLSDLSRGYYPIGLTVDKYMDFFADVKRFSFSAYSLIDASLSADISAFDIIGALNAINNANNATDQVFSSGSTTRQIKMLGMLSSTGAELSTSNTPTATTHYPYHSFTGGGAAIIIDFGRSLFFEGLLYPYISIEFSNGPTSGNFGDPVGSISFLGYGVIAIYSGSASTANRIVVTGTMDVLERYSSLISSSVRVGTGGSITLMANGVSRLSNYTKAYFGNQESTAVGTNRELTIIAPERAYRGPIRIESVTSDYDNFLSYQEFEIF